MTFAVTFFSLKFKTYRSDSPKKELKAITHADVALKRSLEDYCLPSVFDSCTRAVPNDYVNIVADILTEYEVTRTALARALIKGFASHL